MQTRDLKLIADAIRGVYAKQQRKTPLTRMYGMYAVKQTAKAIAASIKAVHPRFDVTEFLAVTGIYCNAYNEDAELKKEKT